MVGGLFVTVIVGVTGVLSALLWSSSALSAAFASNPHLSEEKRRKHLLQSLRMNAFAAISSALSAAAAAGGAIGAYMA